MSESKGSTPPPGKSLNRGISRRSFLKLAGVLAMTGGVSAAVEACEAPPQASGPVLAPTSLPRALQYPEVPLPPDTPPPANLLVFFSPQEAQLVDAITSRLMPGSADDPGAHEAQVTNYIDKLMAFNEGFAEPTYRNPPFAQAYEGDQPPQGNNNPYQVVYVKKDELERYGFQSNLSPREIYRGGLVALDQFSNQKFQKDFVELNPDQQDQVLKDVEDDKAPNFSKPPAKTFFKMIHQHTIEGMFGDPLYGGNKDMAGWKLVGYPGAQRAYTVSDLHNEGAPRPPQSIAMLHNFHPGQPANPNVVIPQYNPDNEHTMPSMP